MTVFDAFVQKLDNTYGKISSSDYAKQLFKQSVDIGTAVVGILSNTGIAGFKFNLPQREQVRMQSEVTDHYIDTNNPVQDHVAQKPVEITLQGLQGDFFYSVNQFEDALAKVVPTLSLVKQFVPRISPVAMRLKTDYRNTMFNIGAYKSQFEKELTGIDKLFAGSEAAYLNNVDLFKLFQDLYKLKSSQTRAFLFFEALWKSKALFTVETTWKRYPNMLITDVKPLRDNNADITDFSVTFKQIALTRSLYRSYQNAAGRTRAQLAKISRKGLDKGKKVSTI